MKLGGVDVGSGARLCEALRPVGSVGGVRGGGEALIVSAEASKWATLDPGPKINEKQ